MIEERSWAGLLRAASDFFGWTYFLAWSLSFYPQPLLNWRRRSTTGLTVDFPLLNVLGFVCYTISTGAFYFSTTVRQQYAVRNPTAPLPTVRLNDFAFALHALVLCAITYSQLWSRLWSFERLPGKRAHRATQGIFCGSIVGLVLVALIIVVLRQNPSDPQSWATIDIVYAASYVKLIVTFCKYIPQAVANWRSKSTRGWSINQILLDFTGGILSISQLIIDSSLNSDWSGVTGNPAKFGLGNVSILFDIIFITQHYVLYRRDDNEFDEEQRALLS